MNELRVPKSKKKQREARNAKKTSSGLIGKFTIKKWTLLEGSFFENFSYFFLFLCHLDTSHFSCRGSLNDKPDFQSTEAQ